MRAIRAIVTCVILLLISANLRWYSQFSSTDQFTAGGLAGILLFILVSASGRYIERK